MFLKTSHQPCLENTKKTILYSFNLKTNLRKYDHTDP